MNQEILQHLLDLRNPEIAEHSQRFFKTAPGEYGFGDTFLGIRVPIIRKAVKQFKTVSTTEATELLKSGFHEVRLFALLLLVYRFSISDSEEQTVIYNIYLKHTKYINNWDLVDSSAHHIVGAYLEHKDRSILFRLASSPLLWERRIAIISTFHFIKKGQFGDTLKIAELLLGDPEDLIHKATGWMLREVGKRDKCTESTFLEVHYKNMPRTMLRYAIEKYSTQERQDYLKGNVRSVTKN